MAYPRHCPRAVEPSGVCRAYVPFARLLRAAALLDSIPLGGKSGCRHALHVGGLGADRNGSYLCSLVASRSAQVPADVSCVMGSFAMPTATCPDGALIHDAARASIVGHLHRPTVG